MQIHELTKRQTQQQIDEGLLSGLKAAVNVAKTGADKFASAMVPGYDDVKDAIATGKSGYAQGAGKGKWAGVKQAAKALASPQAAAQAKNARLQGQAKKDLDAIDAKYNIKSKRPLGWFKQEVQKDAKSADDRNKLVPIFDKTFDIGVVLPDPGRVLTVNLNNAAYYKDQSNKWYQEPEADTPNAKARPITTDSAIQALEALIDKDQYSQIAVPPSMGGAAVPKTKVTKQTQPAANQSPQSALTQGINEAATKGGRPAGPVKLRNGFNKWIVGKIPEFNEVIKQPDVKAELNQLFAKMIANTDDKSASNKLFNDYLITLQAGLARARAKAQGSSEGQPEQSDVEAKLAQFRGQPIKGTSSPEVNQILKQAGLVLSESQVAITKDIVVKTKSGDYVKRHTDQQWYDPNGVLIDPDKYADYIARLDKTPAAQTRYQADAKKGTGSADAFIKGKLPKEPTLSPTTPEPEQHATAADWEAYKAQQNAIQNQLIDQTVNDLRDAEYFKTGQEHYLQQQLAQLMAKKF